MPNSSDYTTKLSPWPVGDTVTRLTETMSKRGMILFAVIDQGAAARSVGMDLRETVLVVFGSPIAGTPVMAAEPLAALDLPLKVLVWAGDDGLARVSYLSPTAFAERWQLAADVIAPLAGIDRITDAVLSVATANQQRAPVGRRVAPP